MNLNPGQLPTYKFLFPVLKTQTTCGNEQARTESVDPHDIILRDVLGGLNDAGMITTNLSIAQPGNIVLLQGTAYILDFGLYENFIEIMPIIAQNEVAVSGQNVKKTDRKKAQNNIKNAFNMVKGMAKVVPWSIHLLMENKDVTVWGTIKKEHLRDDPSALTLKHGPALTGDWYMLGIVDVISSSTPKQNPLFPQLVTSLIEALSTMRPLFGRPDTFVGVTPLLLFRKLSV